MEITSLKQKLFPRATLFLALILSCVLQSYAYSVTINNIKYEISSGWGDSKEASVAGLEDETLSTELVIPDSIEYDGQSYAVTEIRHYAFTRCTGLTSVTIPNSVTEIGTYAFSKCTGLTSVDIPNSVTEISWHLFEGCTGLKSVIIPDTVTEIGLDSFEDCTGLIEVTIPNSVTTIYSSAFRGCTGLTTVTIGKSVSSIQGSAFYCCTGLTRVNIEDLTAWCEIKFGNSDANPLYYAHHLYLNGQEITELVIPDSVTEIKSDAFYGCSGLTSVAIPNSITTIGSSAFDGCSGLTSLTIPNSVTEIGYLAFHLCSGLTSVTIPSSVTTIGERAFGYCSGLTRVNIEDLAAWCEITFADSGSNPLYYAQHLYLNGQEITELVIPDSVTEIKSDAFLYCTGLTSLIIPNSVTSIGSYAFDGCSGLTSVAMGDAVSSIGSYAFTYCTGLTSITIGKSVTSIGSNAFYSCSGLTSVTMGDAVSLIDDNAFRYCTGLVTVKLSEGLTSIGKSAFYRCKSLSGKLTIPRGVETIYAGTFRETGYSVCEILGETVIDAKDQYHDTFVDSVEYPFDKDALGNVTTVIVPSAIASAYRESTWGEYFDIVSNSGIEVSVNITTPGNLAKDIVTQTRKAPASVNKLIIKSGEMNDDDFRVIKDNMTACFDLDLSAAVCENIPENALSDKLVLHSVVLPNSAVSIGKNAFANCPTLESVTVTESAELETVGNSAFSNCNALKTVNLGDKVTSIGDKAFYNAYNLTEFTLPTSLTTIGSEAFYKALSLPSINMGENVASIGNSAFSGCSALKAVVIPSSVTYLGSSAFASCSSLSEITIPRSVESIGASAFSATGLVYVDMSDLGEMTSIEDATFSKCYKLERVAFPKNITSIGDNVFLNCTNLKDADMSETQVSKIGKSAFSGCTKLASISLPATIEDLGAYAFENCRKLQSLSIVAMTPPTAQSTTFKSVPNETCSLLIPTDAFYDYLVASYWGSFVDIKYSFDIEIDGYGTDLGYEVFDSEEEANADVVNGNVDNENSVIAASRSASYMTAKANSNNLSNGISLFVPSSKTVRFHVSDAEQCQVSVFLNDKDVTDRLVNGYLILSNFDEVNKLKVVTSTSGVKDVKTNEDKIDANTIVDVYNLSGVAVMRDIEMGSIGNLSAGIYIVRSANATKKIVIK